MVIMESGPFEICRKSINVVKNEDTSSEWCSSHLAMRTGKGIHFYEFTHNLESYDKKLGCVESFISTPTLSPAKSIFDCAVVRTGLKNIEISEMMLDTALWAHCDQLVQDMANVLMFKFSPMGLVRNRDCALAILNNIGNVNLYSMGRGEWVEFLDLSSLVKDQFKEMLKEEPKNFEELKNISYNLASSSICWAPNIDNGTCYFATSQKSGIILFWSINLETDHSSGYVDKIELVFDEIMHMKWIPKSENSFLLLCSNICGQVMMLECQINKTKVILMKSHMLWEHQDRMIPKYIEYYIDDNGILLFYNKHRHLVCQLLDKNCRIISQSLDNINDYRITSIARNNTDFYVTTINFKLYKIDYSIKNYVLEVAFQISELKDISSTMELYGVSFSPNGVMCALNALDRRIMHKKEPLLMETIFIQTVSDDTLWDKLINNPTKQLTYYWDCIELLRFKISKLKMLPRVDFKAFLSEAETDLYKLKLYLFIVRIYETLVDNIKIANNCLPENSIELLKDKILARQAAANIQKYHSKHVTGKLLSDFEKETFVGSKKYLLFYSDKHKTGSADLPSSDILNIVEDEYKYICQCCDEEINKFSCQHGHLNLFCSITFTPIESSEYIYCKYCNSLGRIEIVPEEPLCVFCDSFMEDCNLVLMNSL